MDEQNNKISDIVFFNADGEYVYGVSQDGIDASIARMGDVVAKAIKYSPYVANMYKNGYGMVRSQASRCPTFKELNFSDNTSVTLYEPNNYETGNTFYFNGQPTQLAKLFIKKVDQSFNIDNNNSTSDYANKNLVCLDDVKCEYTPKIITLVFNDMSIDETYINRTFIFKVDSQIEDTIGVYDDPNRKYDYCTFDSLSIKTSTDDDYIRWLHELKDDDGNRIEQLVQPVELVSYTNMGNPRILTVKLNYGNTLRVYFNGVDLYDKFQIRDGEGDLIKFNVNNHSYYKQYSYKIQGGERKYIKVTDNFDIELNNIYDDTTINIYGHYKDTCDIKINTVGDCSVYDTYEEQIMTEYTEDDDYSEEHHYYTFTNIMSPGYNYYTHKTHYNACDVSYDSSNKPICKIGQTFYVSVDENVYNKFYWKFTGIKKEADGTKRTVVFDSVDYAMNVYGYTTKEDVLKNRLNEIKLQSNETADEFKYIRMKDNDYYGFFVPMDLKHGMTDESTNPMYPLNDFSIRNLYIEVSEIYKPKTVTFYIYDDMDVKMMKADSSVISIYNKADNSDGKYPYKTEIKTIDGDYYVGDNKYNGDNMRITCVNASDEYAKDWYFIADNNIGNKSGVQPLGGYAIINAYDNMTVHLSLSKSVVAYMYITADSTIRVYDIYRKMVVPTDGVTVHTTDATPNSSHMLQAYFSVSSSDTTANVITVEKRFFYVENDMVAEDLSERSSVQISISNGTVQYGKMRTDGYYKISFKNTIRYESKSANVMVMYSDGRNIIPEINKQGTVNYTVNDGNTVFTFVDLTNTTNTYTLSLILSNETKKIYPSATVRYKQRIAETDVASWINASNIMTSDSDNPYTIQIGGDDAFGKAKLLDIQITPQEAIRYSVKIVNTGQLCNVYSYDYVKEEYTSLGDELNITLKTSYDNPNKFKVKFDVKDKVTYNFYTLLYVSPSGLIEHEPNINKFNAEGYAEYEDNFVAKNDYVLTITPTIGNIVYLTFPNGSTLNVTTKALKISDGSNESIIYEKYALDDNIVTFKINGLPESVTSVNLYMYGSDTDDINADNVWVKPPNTKSCNVVDGSISFDYKYNYGFYNDDGSVDVKDMFFKYYKIDVRPTSYVFAVDKAEPCPALRGQSWNIYITKTAPIGVKTSISYSDISLGEEPTIELNDTSTVDTTEQSNFSDYFFVVGTIFNVEDQKIRIILAPKLNLDEFLVGTYSTGTKRYLKTGDVIKNLIKINANDTNYSPSTIYVDCVIGQVITLEWAEGTKNAMVNGKITVQAPWTSTSNKPLYFICKDSSDNIIDVNVNYNFVDESSSFTKSDIYPSNSVDSSLLLPALKGTHTLNLKSNSSISIGEYKIGIKYHLYKQISAIIRIASRVSNKRFWPYTVNESAVNKGYILSTVTFISGIDGDKIPQMTSLGGTEWLSVIYTPSSNTYKFAEKVYNEDCKEYTSISNKPTSGTNLQWGAKLYVLVYSRENSTFSQVGEGFTFASSWSHLYTDKKS